MDVVPRLKWVSPTFSGSALINWGQPANFRRGNYGYPKHHRNGPRTMRLIVAGTPLALAGGCYERSPASHLSISLPYHSDGKFSDQVLK